MPAAHSLAVDVPAGATTTEVRDLLAYVDAHAPATATVAADGGKLVASWSTDPAAPPVRASNVQLGFGVVAGPQSAEVVGQRTAAALAGSLR